jgi:uncharacterized protein (DUF58 family)
MKEILKRLQKYEIQIRKAIKSHMQGDYHSIFKGSGLEFDDVRAYQYGDDIRTIDWNVSAKGHGTFVKTFKEDKEQTVFFLVDVSASQEIGKPGQQKVDIGKEICGVLSLSAIKEGSQVGLLCFSDQKELYVKPGKGMKHGLELITKLYKLNPTSAKTDIGKAFLYSLNLIKRRCVIIIISDFIDNDFEHNFKALAKRHDVVAIHLKDKRETALPSLGIIPLLEKETGRIIWANTSSKEFKEKLARNHSGNISGLERFCGKHQVNYLSLNTDDDYVSKLIKLFKVRNKTKKSA